MFVNKTSSKLVNYRALNTKDQMRNLSVLINSDLIFTSHIKTIPQTALYRLNIARIKGLLSQKDRETLIYAFISSRVAYCNGLVTGPPKKTIKQLQLIQNAAARVLSRTKSTEHITPVHLYTGLQLVTE